MIKMLFKRFFAKLLQGALFAEHCNKILNCEKPTSSPNDSDGQECVENDNVTFNRLNPPKSYADVAAQLRNKEVDFLSRESSVIQKYEFTSNYLYAHFVE